MAISLRLTKNEEELFKSYAKLNNLTVSELVRQSVLQRIENQYDLNTYVQAYQDYQDDSTTVTIEEAGKQLKWDLQ